MAGEPIDVLGALINPVGAIGVGQIVNVPCTVTATGALATGVPVLTLVTKYPAPSGSNVTLTTVYSNQCIIAK